MRTIIILLFFLSFYSNLKAQNGNSENTNIPKDNITVIDNFTTNCIEKLWDIRWFSLGEIENCLYAIEYSKDQINWTVFQEVSGTAYTTGSHLYSVQMMRNSDTNYSFRLRYSCTPSLSLYKIPVSNICPEWVPGNQETSFIVDYSRDENALSLNFKNSTMEKSTICLYSSIGQLLYKEELAPYLNTHKINIPLTLNNPSVIILKLLEGNNVTNKKILLP
ncbi:MAG: hypothetical protein WCP69_15065 [Bacteroidota bacterium]